MQQRMTRTYSIRLNADDNKLFRRAARAAGLSLAEFVRHAARAKAQQAKKKAACLDYPAIQFDTQAEANPRAFIRKRISRKHALHC
jgi:uncharacterized protein (DUF1778 family)